MPNAIHARIEDDVNRLWPQIKAVAATQEKSIQQVVNELLKEWVEKNT